MHHSGVVPFAGVMLLVAAGLLAPLLLVDYQLVFVAEIAVWGLFALSFGLVYGFGGMLSFAQAIYFGAGCYGFNLATFKFGLGTWMRAVRQDRETAIAMGVPSDRVFMVTFGLGTALAMLGGVVAAPLTSVEFRLGLDVLPLCFIAVIIGGLGNLPGTAAAAILLSTMEGAMTALVEPTTARIVSLVLMSVVLLVRPQGIFSRA